MLPMWRRSHLSSPSFDVDNIFILNALTIKLPNDTIEPQPWPHIEELQLADPNTTPSDLSQRKKNGVSHIFSKRICVQSNGKYLVRLLLLFDDSQTLGENPNKSP